MILTGHLTAMLGCTPGHAKGRLAARRSGGVEGDIAGGMMEQALSGTWLR